MDVNNAFSLDMYKPFTVAAFNDDCVSFNLAHNFLALTPEILHCPPPSAWFEKQEASQTQVNWDALAFRACSFAAFHIVAGK
ncbi:MAG TPA: hypothetical protein GXX34_07875 [Clostridia bacterium]|nr:hypothetical protein [Clostridia bacterium]